MEAETLVLEKFMGEVIGDLHTRQGKIKQITAKGPI
jgi:translation elongation factor EF-G